MHAAERPPSLVPCEIRLHDGCLEAMCRELVHTKRSGKKSALIDATLDVEHKCAIELSRCEDHDAKYSDRSVPSSCAAHFPAPRRTLYTTRPSNRGPCRATDAAATQRGPRARAIEPESGRLGRMRSRVDVQPAPAPHLRVRISTTRRPASYRRQLDRNSSCHAASAVGGAPRRAADSRTAARARAATAGRLRIADQRRPPRRRTRERVGHQPVLRPVSAADHVAGARGRESPRRAAGEERCAIGGRRPARRSPCCSNRDRARPCGSSSR